MIPAHWGWTFGTLGVDIQHIGADIQHIGFIGCILMMVLMIILVLLIGYMFLHVYRYLLVRFLLFLHMFGYSKLCHIFVRLSVFFL